MISITTYTSPLGDLLLGESNGRLCLCDWVDSARHRANLHRISHQLNESFRLHQSPTLDYAIELLDAYFDSTIHSFDIPILLVGSKFQIDVWNALSSIDYATTASYKEIAEKIDHPKAVRAVANAIGSNAISIIIPCHRIIGSKGALTGYAGGLATKLRLLNLEQQHSLPLRMTPLHQN